MNEALDLNNWRDESEDTRAQRDWWWKTLFQLKGEFNIHSDSPTVSNSVRTTEFNDWLKETYGVSMNYDLQGNILADYEIVDEHKHTVFLLKWV